MSSFGVVMLSIMLLWPAYLLGAWLMAATRELHRSRGETVTTRVPQHWPMAHGPRLVDTGGRNVGGV